MNNLKCEFCDYDILKTNKLPFDVFVNNKLTLICFNCFMNNFYKTKKRCSICGKKIDYGVYFFKKGKNISVVCKECNDLMYRKEKVIKK